MPNSLRSTLAELADSFAQAVLEVVRTVSLAELGAEGGAAPRAAPRGARPGGSAAGRPHPSPSGRLPRRSAADIAQLLDRVVALVRKHKGGLRAEQIRSELGLEAKELPRVLKEGLGAKKLKSKGWKRATTYHAS
jgi:hypothetical protein